VTSQALAATLLGVLGVYLIGGTITEAGTVVFYATLDSPEESLAEMHRHQLVVSSVWAVFKLSFGIILFVFRDRLGSLIAGSGAAETNPPVDTFGLQSALIAVVGLYFVIKGGAILLGGFVGIPEGYGPSYLWPQYASSVAEVTFGVLLFFGAHGLAGAWHSARRAGRDRLSRPAA
jgi:hypothetical protein